LIWWGIVLGTSRIYSTAKSNQQLRSMCLEIAPEDMTVEECMDYFRPVQENP